MKVFKRNAVIITVLVFVCAAVYLNWSYDRKSQVTEPEKGGDVVMTEISSVKDAENTYADETAPEEPGLFYTAEPLEPEKAEVGVHSELEEKFAAVRLARREARDEAQTTLETVAGTEGADQEVVDEALRKMTELAELSVKEVELENIIASKGFIDCVVYLSDDSATVTVATDVGLSSASVAKITDVIINETNLKASQLRVVEIG